MASHKQSATFFESARQIIGLLFIVFLIRTFGFGLYQVPTGSMETTMLVGERFFADKVTYLLRTVHRGDIIAFNDPIYPYSHNKLKRLFENYVWGPSNWTKRVIGIPGDTIKGVIEEGKPVIYLNGEKLNEPYVNQYPLICILKGDTKDIAQQVEQEAVDLISQRRLDSSMVSRFIENRLCELHDWRSYDPEKPYAQQPFYSMNSNHVVADNDGKPAVKNPNTPIREESIAAQHQEGKNFFNGSDEFFITLGAGQYWVMGDNRQGSKDSRFIGPIDGSLIHGRILFRIWSVDSAENWWIIDLIKHPIEFWSRVRWGRFFQVVA